MNTSKVNIIDRKDVSGDLLTQLNEAMIFVKRHLSVKSDIIEFDRKDTYEVPLEALREAVINAIVHRDYSVTGTSQNGIKYHLDNLKKTGLIERIGPDKGERREVRRDL